MIDALAARGMVTGSAPRQVLVETYTYLVAPETHEHFVPDVGWAQESYRDWLDRGPTDHGAGTEGAIRQVA